VLAVLAVLAAGPLHRKDAVLRGWQVVPRANFVGRPVGQRMTLHSRVVSYKGDATGETSQ
jgi:hypothetical protein